MEKARPTARPAGQSIREKPRTARTEACKPDEKPPFNSDDPLRSVPRAYLSQTHTRKSCYTGAVLSRLARSLRDQGLDVTEAPKRAGGEADLVAGR